MPLGLPTLVIVGHGHAGRGLVDDIVGRGRRLRILVLDDNHAGGGPGSEPPSWASAGVEVHRGVRVVAINPTARRLVAGGVAIPYDALVIATGPPSASPGTALTSLPTVDGRLVADIDGRVVTAVFAIGSCAVASAEPARVADAVALHLGGRLAAGSSAAIAIPPPVDPGADPTSASTAASAPYPAGADGAETPLYGATPPPDLPSLLVVAAASASAWSASCRSSIPPRWRRS